MGSVKRFHWVVPFKPDRHPHTIGATTTAKSTPISNVSAARGIKYFDEREKLHVLFQILGSPEIRKTGVAARRRVSPRRTCPARPHVQRE